MVVFCCPQVRYMAMLGRFRRRIGVLSLAAVVAGGDGVVRAAVVGGRMDQAGR